MSIIGSYQRVSREGKINRVQVRQTKCIGKNAKYHTQHRQEWGGEGYVQFSATWIISPFRSKHRGVRGGDGGHYGVTVLLFSMS